MSELSDQIQESLEGTRTAITSSEKFKEWAEQSGYTPDNEGDMVMAVPLTDLSDGDEYPSLRAMQSYYDSQIKIVTKRFHRRYLGMEPAEDNETAWRRTKDDASVYYLPMVVGMYADGVHIGHEVSRIVKKYKYFNKLDDLWDSSSFDADRMTLIIQLLDDADTMTLFKELLNSYSINFANAVAFNAMPGELASTKVWDLWYLTVKAMNTVLYMAGVILGRKWKENDVLVGIELASEE